MLTARFVTLHVIESARAEAITSVDQQIAIWNLRDSAVQAVGVRNADTSHCKSCRSVSLAFSLGEQALVGDNVIDVWAMRLKGMPCSVIADHLSQSSLKS